MLSPTIKLGCPPNPGEPGAEEVITNEPVTGV